MALNERREQQVAGVVEMGQRYHVARSPNRKPERPRQVEVSRNVADNDKE